MASTSDVILRVDLAGGPNLSAIPGMLLALQITKERVMRLDIKAFALACAIVGGLGLPVLTWWIIAFEGPSTAPTWLSHIYRGYTLTWTGSFIGGVWAFFDGLIGGAIFAWLYDLMEARTIGQHRMAA